MHRTTAVLGSLLVPLLLVAACGSPPPDASADADGTGGTLRLALSSDPSTLNPNLSTDYATSNPAALWAEGLVDLDSASQPVPQLAEEWTVSEDGLTYTFDLRQDVTWHDGEAFNADDVVYTLTESLEFVPTASRFIDYVESVTKSDDFTVTVQLNTPFAGIMAGLSRAVTAILPEHVYAGTDIQMNPANSAPIGTGPYKFASWERGQRLTFERNPDYWVEDQPHMDTVTYQIIPEDTTRINALRNGEIDWAPADELPLAQLELLDQQEDLVLMDNIGDVGTTVLAFNTAEGPTANVLVRRALTMAIDREQILSSAFQGIGTVGTTLIPPAFGELSSTEHTYDAAYPFDTAAANALLDEAGFPRQGDARFTLRLVVSQGPEYTATANIMASQLQAVGIGVDIVQPDNETRNQMVFTDSDFDLFVANYTSFFDPALGVHRMYVCSSVGVNYGNASRFCDPALDTAFAAADAATTVEDRAAAYDEVSRIAIDAVPNVALRYYQDSGYASARLNGLDEQFATGAGRPDWATVTVAAN